MSEILISPILTDRADAGWTVRHRAILFERFDSRVAAIRRGRRLASQLRKLGRTASLRVIDRGPPLAIRRADKV